MNDKTFPEKTRLSSTVYLKFKSNQKTNMSLTIKKLFYYIPLFKPFRGRRNIKYIPRNKCKIYCKGNEIQNFEINNFKILSLQSSSMTFLFY